MPREEAHIRTLVDTWHAATQAGDLDTVLSLMTDDAVFLVPGRPPLDKAEFAKLSRVPPGAPRPTFESASEIMEVQVSGDLAYLWSRLSVRVTPPGADPPIERAGHTLTIFRRVDGEWRLAIGDWRGMRTCWSPCRKRTHERLRALRLGIAIAEA